jgi:hypothetical protein
VIRKIPAQISQILKLNFLSINFDQITCPAFEHFLHRSSQLTFLVIHFQHFPHLLILFTFSNVHFYCHFSRINQNAIIFFSPHKKAESYGKFYVRKKKIFFIGQLLFYHKMLIHYQYLIPVLLLRIFRLFQVPCTFECFIGFLLDFFL